MSSYSPVGEYLRNTVYPNLDAASAGILDGYNPVRRNGSKYYSLDCPSCQGKHTAYYYPGTGAIHCNRRNKCERLTTSIWDIVAQDEPSKKAVLERLCSAAGVPMPEDGRTPTQKTAASLAHDFLAVVREALWSTPAAIDYLKVERRMTEQEIKSARIGYYPNPDHIRSALKAKNADMQAAEKWGLFVGTYKFSGRIVGYWEQPDGSISLWGRGFGKSLQPYVSSQSGELVEPNKYEYQFGLVKTIPYRFTAASRRTALVAVEGPLDAERMVVNGFPAVGVGGALVIPAQAAFLASAGISSLIHLTDGDRAGHDGALGTIRSCEPLGISVMVAEVPEEMDDPDKLIATQGPEPISALLDTALSSGRFLVSDLTRLAKMPDQKYPTKARDLLNLASRLTRESRLAFDEACKAENYHLPDNKAAALHSASILADLGVPVDEIERLVAERYRYRITISEVKEDE